MAAYRPSTTSHNNGELVNNHDFDNNNQEEVDIFGDEFAEDYAESIRTIEAPSENPFLDTATPFEDSSTEQAHQPILSNAAPDGSRRPVIDSVRKPTHLEDVEGIERPSRAASRRHDDGPYASAEVQRLMGSGRSNRSSSASSSFSFAPSRSSVGNPSGPSHPYTLYPQGLGVSRSESIASASTGRPSRGPGRNGPLHPYTMYPQNTTHTSGTGSAAPSLAPPPSETYEAAQRINADRDSIRSDALSEQLPPYSILPDELHTKIAAGPPLPAPSRTSTAEMQERSQPNPFASTTTITNSTIGQELPIYHVGEKPAQQKTKERWYRNKICGVIPAWLLMLGIGLIALAAICGGVIGAAMSHKSTTHEVRPPNSTSSASTAYIVSDVTVAISTLTSTQYVDASPTSMPPYSPAAPTGSFELFIENPSSSSNSSACLTNPYQQAAWSCNLADTNPYWLEIVDLGPNQSFLNLSGTAAAGPSYGTQPIIVRNQPLRPVFYNASDDALDEGPAWHFETFYDKLVILPAAALTLASANYRRDRMDFYPLADSRAISVHDESAWFCWFNNTMIEGFVFIDGTVPASSTSESTSSTTAAPFASSTETWESMSVSTTPTVIAQVSATTASTTSPSATPWNSFWTSRGPPASLPTGWPVPGWPATTSCATAASLLPHQPAYNSWSQPQRRQESSTWPTPTIMTHPFKLKEIRVGPSAPPAVCTQMSILSTSPFVYVPMRPNGAEVVITLNETDPSPHDITFSSSPTPMPTSWAAQRRSPAEEPCYCEWKNA